MADAEMPIPDWRMPAADVADCGWQTADATGTAESRYLLPSRLAHSPAWMKLAQ
jgi:hypothetical protein